MDNEKQEILDLLQALRDDIELSRKLRYYSIAIAGKREFIKAYDIRSKLVALIRDQDLPATSDPVKAVLRIDHLAHCGEAYSNQCFDVLSSALSILERMGVKS